MNDPRQPQRATPPGSGYEPPEPRQQYYPPIDPAYADQLAYTPTYGLYAPPPPPGGGPPLLPEAEFPAPTGRGSPRWLWFALAAAVLLVIGMVVALVIANGLVEQPTAVPPLPAMPSSSAAAPTPTQSQSTSPEPTTVTDTPTDTTHVAAMQAVLYTVTGQGRAISITYRDTGNVMETEFNVLLPWSKQVSLPESGSHPAILTIINIGFNVTCAVTVGGVPVHQRTGAGLTVCTAGS